jgi:adiponectin receptor
MRNIFLAVITISCSAAFAVCMIPELNQAKFRAFRGFLFIFLGISAGAPYIYIKNFADKRYIDEKTSVFLLIFGGAVYIGGALIYVFRIPERWYPKKFDLFGSSHNIFHFAVLIGCAIHF